MQKTWLFLQHMVTSGTLDKLPLCNSNSYLKITADMQLAGHHSDKSDMFGRSSSRSLVALMNYLPKSCQVFLFENFSRVVCSAALLGEN